MFCVTLFSDAADRSVRSEPVPAWVRPASLPVESATDTVDVSAGTRELLVDEQYDVRSQTLYRHLARRILTAAALQNETKITETFDPSCQHLIFHHVTVHRGGRTIDLLDIRRIKVIQQEQDLDHDLYDGRLTAVFLLEDLRRDDVLEYDYSIVGKNPIFNNKFYGAFELQWTVPVKRIHYRLIVPNGRTITITPHGRTLTPAVSSAPGAAVYSWQQENVPGLHPDPDLPGWYSPFPWIQLSEYRSWGDVAQWASGLFQLRPADIEPLRPKIAELARTASSDELFVHAALRFVQDDIRYFGIEIGSQSHQPSPPALTLRRRYGDCKDKTLLFCALLKGRNIETSPVLVNTTLENAVSDFAPTPIAFNHVVARVILNGRVRYFDPTISDQRGVLPIVTFPYRLKGLVVEPSTTELTAIDDNSSSFSRVELEEWFTVTDLTGPAKLRVITRYYGNDANSFRSIAHQRTAQELERMGNEYYANEYYRVNTVVPLHVLNDDQDANILTLEEEYTVDSLFQYSEKDRRRTAMFYATLLKNDMQIPTSSQRTMPLGIPYPTHIRYDIRIALPEEWNFEPDNVVIDDPSFFYSSHVGSTGQNVRMQYEFRTKRDTVSAAAVQQYVDQLTKARDDVGNSLHKYDQHPSNTSSEFYTVLVFVLLTAIAVTWRWRGYFFHPVPSTLIVPEAGSAEVSGIKGWLLLPAISLIIAPFMTGFQLLDTILPVFNAAPWDRLTTPGSPAYHPFYASVLMMELYLSLIMVPAAILLSRLFFRKYSVVPQLMIGWYVYVAAIPPAETLFAMMLGLPDMSWTSNDTMNLVRGVISVSVWVPYFLYSVRVKNTFIHGAPAAVPQPDQV